ncbi:hypothetical protein D1605_006975 [Xylella fastidiosa subsp. fastidiosa]|nr:hypothetical protein [Xylella fastidiosa subsp. fastidiosa]NMR00947.1 hypothetical protein [Xylella fastidiosa]MBE0265008.1 hypothetical protein [Xylella fastidiosa subsp. fastidiosa]MBE0266977.1 hypothetical protein [Xylella fastidiosa subsp. fastidiosa]MBE0271666.1 hypothetical protein [Xylella fastidiosa subsp. fastidiosa]
MYPTDTRIYVMGERKRFRFFNEKLKQLFKSTYIIQSMHIRKMLRKTWF